VPAEVQLAGVDVDVAHVVRAARAGEHLHVVCVDVRVIRRRALGRRVLLGLDVGLVAIGVARREAGGVVVV